MNIAEREFFEEKLQEIKELKDKIRILSIQREHQRQCTLNARNSEDEAFDKIEELEATVATQCQTNLALTHKVGLAEMEKRLLSTENERLRDTLRSIAKFALKKEYDNDELG